MYDNTNLHTTNAYAPKHRRRHNDLELKILDRTEKNNYSD